MTVTVSHGQATWKLQEVQLKDTFLITQIENLIVSLESYNDHFAQGLGYIRVFQDSNKEDSVSRQYFVSPSLHTIRDHDIKPQFYSWVKERPVLIYYEYFDRLIKTKISKKSFRRLNRTLNKFLLPYVHFKGKDDEGNPIKFRYFRDDLFVRGGFIIRYNYQGKPSIDFDTHYPGEKEYFEKFNKSDF